MSQWEFFLPWEFLFQKCPRKLVSYWMKNDFYVIICAFLWKRPKRDLFVIFFYFIFSFHCCFYFIARLFFASQHIHWIYSSINPFFIRSLSHAFSKSFNSSIMLFRAVQRGSNGVDCKLCNYIEFLIWFMWKSHAKLLNFFLRIISFNHITSLPDKFPLHICIFKTKTMDKKIRSLQQQQQQQQQKQKSSLAFLRVVQSLKIVSRTFFLILLHFFNLLLRQSLFFLISSLMHCFLQGLALVSVIFLIPTTPSSWSSSMFIVILYVSRARFLCVQ